MTPRWKVVWITGASSGIGHALTVALARRGILVAASARRADALDAITREVAGVTPFALDVTDLAACKAVAAEIATRLGPIDLAIFNAGIGAPLGARDFSAQKAAAMMAVNYQGLANGIEAVLPAMLARRSGQIALMSSLAGYRGLPNAAGYCPSKAAAISRAEALAPDLAAESLAISVINPGFVATPMTAGARRPLPFVIDAEDCARRIIAGLERRRFEIAFPWTMVTLARLARLVPYWLWFRLVRRTPTDERKEPPGSPSRS